MADSGGRPLGRHDWRRMRPWSAMASLFVLVVSLAGCTPFQERNAAAYCHKYKTGFAQIKRDYPDVDQYASSNENPLLMLLSLTSASGDIVALIGDMGEVAPDDIQTDVERVHDTLQKQM